MNRKTGNFQLTKLDFNRDKHLRQQKSFSLLFNEKTFLLIFSKFTINFGGDPLGTVGYRKICRSSLDLARDEIKKADAQWGLENNRFTKLNIRSRGLWHEPLP